MSTTKDQWLTAAEEATIEVAVQALGMATPEILPDPVLEPGGGMGSYVPVMSSAWAIQIGICTDETGCANLTRALLGMEPEEAVEHADVTDAIGEIANMVAGGVKRRLNDDDDELKLGLPIFIDGVVETSQNVSVVSAKLDLGGTAVALRVILGAIE